MERGVARMWRVALMFLFHLMTEGTRLSPPGKPRLTRCRSPEKETFTCWWEPGSSGGLATVHSLFYRKENTDADFECPDYHTAGNNSCFFDKSHTSIWVNYNITVVATNALGKSYSDPEDVDVMYIVQPYPPENVTLTLVRGESLYLQVKWEPPHMADTRSGWITLSYQLVAKRQTDHVWAEHFAGHQKHFQLFSLHPGDSYEVKVRCKPDHGYWSEWTAPVIIQVPDYIPRERSVWIIVAIFCLFVFVIFSCSVDLKKSRVKLFLFPPVPGPKIKGFDKQHLKSGKPEEVFSVLTNPGFPLTFESNDLLVDYLEVSDTDEQELVPDGGAAGEAKSSADGCTGQEGGESVDVLTQRCNQEPVTQNQEHVTQNQEHVTQNQEHVTQNQEQIVDGHGPQGRVRIIPENTSHASESDGSGSANKKPERNCSSHDCVPEPLYHCPEMPIQGVCSAPKTASVCQQEHQTAPIKHRSAWKQGTSSIESERKRPQKNGSALPQKSMEYVEVQKVNWEKGLILQPKAEEMRDSWRLDPRRQDYSKVSGVVDDGVLLLQKEVAPPSCPTARGLAEGLHQRPDGYVDTDTMLPTH